MDVTLLGNEGLLPRCNQVQIRSYCIRASKNPMTNVLIRRGKLGHRVAKRIRPPERKRERLE